jgi:hypothetical protein
MCPPFDRPRTVIRRSGRHHAEIELFHANLRAAQPQDPGVVLRFCVNRGKLGYDRNMARSFRSQRQGPLCYPSRHIEVTLLSVSVKDAGRIVME